MPSKFGFSNSSFDLSEDVKNEWEIRFTSQLHEIVEDFSEYKGMHGVTFKKQSSKLITTLGKFDRDFGSRSATYSPGSAEAYSINGEDVSGRNYSFEIAIAKRASLVVVFAQKFWPTSHIKEDAIELARALLGHVECTSVSAYIADAQLCNSGRMLEPEDSLIATLRNVFDVVGREGYVEYAGRHVPEFINLFRFLKVFDEKNTTGESEKARYIAELYDI